MDQLSQAQRSLWEMDALAAQSSPIHRLHPVCKLLITVAYIFTVVSFPKYDLSGLAVMVLLPVVLYQLAGVPVRLCFCKLRLVLPLVCAVGLVNPFLDHSLVLRLGSFPVTGGMLSMVTLMLKGIFSLMASFLLMATTSMDSLCAGLRKLRVPGLVVTLLLLTYRYIGLMLGEVRVMTESYRLRAPEQKGIHISAWGSFLGQLLLRSMDRAQELYDSMRLRGFRGEFFYADIRPWRWADTGALTATAASLILCRCFDIPALLGGILVGG